MAITIQRYNHTRQQLLTHPITDTLKVMLCSAATFDATDATLADVTRTEISGNGYPAGGVTLTGVAASVVATDDASLDADDMSVTASGGAIAAAFGIVYNDTATGDPPYYFINFDGTVTAPDGLPFVIEWPAAGIETFGDPA